MPVSVGNPQTSAGNALSWDGDDQLVGYGSSLVFGYNGDGLRTKRSWATGRTWFLSDVLSDGEEPVVELNASGAVSAVNTFGANGLVSRRAGTSSVFYAFDPFGSAAERLSSAGAVLASYRFDATGNRTGTDASADPYSGLGGQWGYYDETASTGWLLLGHRFYAPALGRFLNRDPIGFAGGINLYGYVGNDPVNKIDPSGLANPPGYNPRTWRKIGAKFFKPVDGRSELIETWWWHEKDTWHKQGHFDVHQFFPDRITKWRYYPNGKRGNRSCKWELKSVTKWSRGNQFRPDDDGRGTSPEEVLKRAQEEALQRARSKAATEGLMKLNARMRKAMQNFDAMGGAADEE